GADELNVIDGCDELRSGRARRRQRLARGVPCELRKRHEVGWHALGKAGSVEEIHRLTARRKQGVMARQHRHSTGLRVDDALREPLRELWKLNLRGGRRRHFATSGGMARRSMK